MAANPQTSTPNPSLSLLDSIKEGFWKPMMAGIQNAKYTSNVSEDNELGQKRQQKRAQQQVEETPQGFDFSSTQLEVEECLSRFYRNKARVFDDTNRTDFITKKHLEGLKFDKNLKDSLYDATSFSLSCKHGKYNLTDSAVVIDNGKKEEISPRQALSASALMAGNGKSKKVKTSGKLYDRMMLQLAAQECGLEVANPISKNDPNLSAQDLKDIHRAEKKFNRYSSKIKLSKNKGPATIIPPNEPPNSPPPAALVRDDEPVPETRSSFLLPSKSSKTQAHDNAKEAFSKIAKEYSPVVAAVVSNIAQKLVDQENKTSEKIGPNQKPLGSGDVNPHDAVIDVKAEVVKPRKDFAAAKHRSENPAEIPSSGEVIALPGNSTKKGPGFDAA